MLDRKRLRYANGDARPLGVHARMVLGAALGAGAALVSMTIAKEHPSRNAARQLLLAEALFFLAVLISTLPWRRIGMSVAVNTAALAANSGVSLLLSKTSRQIAVGPMALILLILWIANSIAISSIVLLHNRYRPDYGRGFCRNCGYDLRGGHKEKCPECGRTIHGQ